MPQDTSTQATLANRYNAEFARQVSIQLQNLATAHIDLFDIMAINQAAADLRAELKQTLSQYRALNTHKTTVVVPFHTYHQAALLRRHIQYLWKSYNTARNDSATLTAEYMTRLTPYTPSYMQDAQIAA